jgi:16S rRNA (cytosine967-C5)-methyltransferase
VEAGDVTKTEAYRTGQIVIQDEASQLVAALVDHVVPGQGFRILDCCAAPGGKTLAIADANPDATITAVELHPHRARLLQKLLQRHASRIQIVTADAQQLPVSQHFDRVLADVPCSGTGTLARNPEIKWRLTPSDLSDLAARQLAILRSALAQVVKGGRVIYSTCSLEKEENENVIERAAAETGSFRVLDCRAELDHLKSAGKLSWSDTASLTSGSYLRTLPGVHPCDGFFAAILERSA